MNRMGTYQLPKTNAEKRVSYTLNWCAEVVKNEELQSECCVNIFENESAIFFDTTTPTTFRFKHSRSSFPFTHVNLLNVSTIHALASPDIYFPTVAFHEERRKK